MKRLIMSLGAVLLCGTVFFTSCSKKDELGINPKPALVGEIYYQTAQVVVPLGCKEIFVEYKDENGKLTTQSIAVNPTPEVVAEGRNATPFGNLTINIQAPAKTLVNVYEKNNQKGVKNYLIRNLATSIPLNSSDIEYWSATSFNDYFYAQSGVFGAGFYNPKYFDLRCIHEPSGDIYTAVYKGSQSDSNSKSDSNSNSDSDSGNIVHITIGGEKGVESTKVHETQMTYYHSSGVVMFDDSWPRDPGFSHELSDYNDIVIDYDIEAKLADNSAITGNMNFNGKEALTVVMHIRANGGVYPEGAGLAFEGLKIADIEKIETYLTLDSWQNPHGELPTAAKEAIKLSYDLNGNYPIFKISGLDWLNEHEATQVEYKYIDDRGQESTHVFNPRYKPANTSQYKTGKINFVDLNYAYYNTTPGFINVNGGLITATYVITLKNRTNLCCGESEAQAAGIINAVVKTETQNFFITTLERFGLPEHPYSYEIHCKGYKPTPAFEALYNQVNMGHETLYYSGIAPAYKSWGMKAPVMTRHPWAGNPFVNAYPNYTQWLSSHGTEHTDWYINGIDDEYLVCWW